MGDAMKFPIISNHWKFAVAMTSNGWKFSGAVCSSVKSPSGDVRRIDSPKGLGDAACMTTIAHKGTPAVLTIAGSDSGGGAGLQADLKTFEALGVFGTSAVTCVTAQSPSGVRGVAGIDPGMVSQQIAAVCEAFPIAAVKTGMLFSKAIVGAVASSIVSQGLLTVVVDPVMVASSGARLMDDEGIDALCRELLPQARVITPNLHEAEILVGRKISNAEELKRAARDICERFDVACVAKGAGLPGDVVLDVVFDEGEEYLFKGPRVPAVETHGCGCAFSAAIAACLARGLFLSEAVVRAKAFVARALHEAIVVGGHRPLNFAVPKDAAPASC